MQKKIQNFATICLVGVLILLGASCTNNPTTSEQTTTGNNTTSTTKNEPQNTTNSINNNEDTSDEDTSTIVNSDVYGEDLTLVNRYPKSIRSYYSQSDLETTVTFQTTATQDEVREYYKKELIAKGWENSETATDYVEFIKGDEDNPEYLTVYLTPYTNILEYELVYEPAYTEEQLKELDQDDVIDSDAFDL